MYLKLNKIQYPVYNLGPGKRIGVWLQGCSLKCPGCINKSLWDENKGKYIDVGNLVKSLMNLRNEYDGITVSGGEPFDQYHSLMAFCAMVKQLTDFDIYCFSGYYLKELEKKYRDKLFKFLIDYLVDGRFIRNNPSGNNIMGSANQKVYKLHNGRAYCKKNMFSENKKWSLNYNEKVCYMAGIPAENELKKVSKILYSNNIKSKYL